MIDIIIVSYYNYDLLNCLIESIHKYTQHDFKIIVVDNTPKQDRDEIEHVDRVILTEENVGYATALNMGIKEVSSPFVALLNNDIEVTPFWDDRAIQCFENNPPVGIVGYKLVGMDGKIKGYGVSDDWEAIEFGVPIDESNLNKVLNVKAISGAAMVVKREVLEDVQFNESYRHYFEDAQFCLDAKKHGWDCVVVPHVIYHRHMASSELTEKGFYKEVFRKGLEEFKRHYPNEKGYC